MSRGVVFPTFRGELVAGGGDGAAHARRARSRPCACRATRSTCSRSRSWRWSRSRTGRSTSSSAVVRRASPVRRARRGDPARGARHAGGPLPERGVRGAAAADRVGPGARRAQRAARRAAARGDQRRHHPRPRAVRRLPGRQRDRPSDVPVDAERSGGDGPGRQARRRARRGDGLRVAGRRHVHARLQHVAHRRHHARPRAGDARRPGVPGGCRSGRATPPAGRRSSAGRWARWVRELGALPDDDARGAGRGAPGWTRGRPTTCSRTCASSARRPASCPSDTDAGGRAVPRRARRLAGRPALPVRRPRARAVGDRHRRAAARAVRRGRRGDALRRRDRAAAAGHAGRRATARLVDDPWAGVRRTGDRPARTCCVDPDEVLDAVRAELGSLGDVRRPVPRGREPRAAAAPPPARTGASRCGSSASGRRSCCPWRPSTPTSRSCSRPCASACRTTSTPRRSPTLMRDVAARRVRVVEVTTTPAVPVRAVAAVRLHRAVPLRRRRPAGRAPRRRADARPDPAGRAARPGRRVPAGRPARPGRGRAHRGRAERPRARTAGRHARAAAPTSCDGTGRSPRRRSPSARSPRSRDEVAGLAGRRSRAPVA